MNRLLKLNNLIKDYFNISVFKLSFYDFSKLYKGSVLGVFWTFFKPVFSTAVFYLGNLIINPSFTSAFTQSNLPNWLSLIIGMLVWNYLSEALSGNSNVLSQYSFLITKMKYKKSKIYLFSNISKFFQHFVLMMIFFVVYIAVFFTTTEPISGEKPNIDQFLYLLQLPIVAILMMVFFTCWTSFVAPICVISNDFKQVVFLFVTSIFWISGTFFDTTSLINVSDSSGSLSSFNVIVYNVICLNPLATFISLFRSSFVGSVGYKFPDGTSSSDFNWFFSGQWTSEGVFVGYWYKIVITLIWCVVFVLIGYFVSKKTKGWLNDLL